MAGDWIKMRTNLRRHPKVVRMASALDADRLRVVGGLHAVWSVFDEHSDDGTLVGYTSVSMDSEIGCEGFCAAMIAVDWLADTGESLVIPRSDAHNGVSAKRRAQETERKREARGVRKVSASDADKLRAREEKSREDQEQDQKTSKRSESDKVPIDPASDRRSPLPEPNPNRPLHVQAAQAMRIAGGVEGFNPTDPRLLAVIADGATPEMLAAAVTEALGKFPPISSPTIWAIKTTASRIAEGKANSGVNHARSGSKLSAADQVEAIAARHRDARARAAGLDPDSDLVIIPTDDRVVASQ